MAPFPKSRAARLRERNATFESLLAPTDGAGDWAGVEMYGFRHLCQRGVPDHPNGLRPAAWRLLLGLTTPADRTGWTDETAGKRNEYRMLRTLLIEKAVKQAPVDHDHPLSIEDQRLGQIDADVRRTQAMLAFFSTPLPAQHVDDLDNRLDGINPDRVPPTFRSPQPLPRRQRTLRPSPPVASPPQSPQARPGLSKLNMNLAPVLQVQEPSPVTALETPVPMTALESPATAISPLQSPGLSTDDEDDAFATPTEGSPSQPLASIGSRPLTYRDCLTRLLFVYASLNPGVGFIQGMADLAAVMLYVFGNANVGGDPIDAEADAFWAFTALMAEVRDVFVRSLDGPLSTIDDPSSPASWAAIGKRTITARTPSTKTGIGALLNTFAETLKWLDPRLAGHLSRQGVEPSFYAFRWLTCLCAQEFSLPDVIRLWDTFLALLSGGAGSSGGSGPALEFMVDFCCVLVLVQRDRLLSTGFAGCLGALQRVGHELPLDPEMSEGGVDALCAQALQIRQRRLADQMLATPTAPQARNPISQPTTPNADYIDRDIWLGYEDEKSPRDQRRDPYDEEEEMETLGPSPWESMQKLASRFGGKSKDAADKRMSVESSQTEYSTASAPSVTSSGLFEHYRDVVKSRAEAWKDTDAAAALSKKATNWQIAASNWRAQAPTALSSLQPPVVLRAENLSTLGAKWSKAGADILRPPSPPDAPFSPPSDSSASNHSDSPSWNKRNSLLETPNGAAPMRKAASDGASGGPKPLLLSSSARPAHSSENGESPHMSRRSSWYAESPVSIGRAPSPSPPSALPSSSATSGLPSALRDRTASEADRPIPILGRANSPSQMPKPKGPGPASPRLVRSKHPLSASTRYGPNRRHTSAQSDVTPLSAVDRMLPPMSAIERALPPLSAVAPPRRAWRLTDAPASPPSPEVTPMEQPPRKSDEGHSSASDAYEDAESTPVTRSSSWKMSHQRDDSDASQASAHANDYEPRGPPSIDASAVPVPPVPTGPRKPRTSSLAKLNLAALDGTPPPKSEAQSSPAKAAKGIRKLYKRLSSNSVLQDAVAEAKAKEAETGRTSDETLVDEKRRSGTPNRDSNGSQWDEDDLLASYHAATASLGVN